MTSGPVDRAVGGSYLCTGYELRITARCLADDLDWRPGARFADLAEQASVTAFVSRRAESPTNSRLVGPLRSPHQIYWLAGGEAGEGATWYDEDNDVVWLLASADVGDSESAARRLQRLDQQQILLPNEGDYRALFLDRDNRFSEACRYVAPQLLETARANPGVEHFERIADRVGVSLIIDELTSLQEACVIVQARGLTPEYLSIILASFFPGSFDEIESPSEVLRRHPDQVEFAFRGRLP